MENELMDKIKNLEERISGLEKSRQKMNPSNEVATYLQRLFSKSNVLAGFFLSALLFSSFLYAVNKPHTFSSGTTASASEVNSNFDALFDYVNSGVMVGLTSIQNVTLGTTAAITFDTTLYGDSNNFDSGNNRIDIQDSGVYMFSYLTNITGSTMCIEEVNYNSSPAQWSNNHIQAFSAGDTISMDLNCTSSGTNADIQTADSFMMVKRVW